MTQDLYGNKYAKYSNLKDGATIWNDGGSPCLTRGSLLVHFSDKGAYVECLAGQHRLDRSQDEKSYCIGFYDKEPMFSGGLTLPRPSK